VAERTAVAEATASATGCAGLLGYRPVGCQLTPELDEPVVLVELAGSRLLVLTRTGPQIPTRGCRAPSRPSMMAASTWVHTSAGADISSYRARCPADRRGSKTAGDAAPRAVNKLRQTRMAIPLPRVPQLKAVLGYVSG